MDIKTSSSNPMLQLVLALSSLIVVVCVFLLTVRAGTSDDALFLNIEIPETWSKSYNEDSDGYAMLEEYLVTDWSQVDAEEDWQSVTTRASMTITENFVAAPKLTHMTQQDSKIAQLGENDAWNLISNGLFKSYPTGSFNAYADQLRTLKMSNTKTITVNVWYWANPGDIYDMSKTTKQFTIAVNSSIADLFEHTFADIYAHESQPVINLADKGMGTWVLRGKNHNNDSGISAHALGCAIDINPSTGSFKVDGMWYGNSYGQPPMPKSIWEQLPECHSKYHVLYDGCPIVEIFKAYGFCWGGDWNSIKDCMHLSYIGDGSNARAIATKNYMDRR